MRPANTQIARNSDMFGPHSSPCRTRQVPSSRKRVATLYKVQRRLRVVREEYGERLKIKIGNLIYFAMPSIKQLIFC
jgi:hypothetical protein